MGIWDVLKKKLVNDGERHHTGLDEQMGKNVYEIASFDINSATLTDKINYFLSNRSQGEQIQLADKLLREGPFEAGIEMYQALIQKYPEERDRYENGIGTAYLKMNDFNKAIEYYVISRSHGMHPDITDKNVWDACLKEYKKTNDIYYIEKYFSHSENGKQSHLANDLLRNAGKFTSNTIPLEPSITSVTSDLINEENSISSKNVETQIIENADSLNVEETLNNENVAKKDKEKQSAENQFSLFGFGENKEPENKSETSDSSDSKSSNLEIPTDHDKKIVFEDVVIETNENIPVEEPPTMLRALDYHIDQFFKNEDVVVWKDKRNDNLRIDIYHIKPNDERPYNLLLTFGMSRAPMNVPAGAEQFSYGELAIILPVDWNLSEEGLKDPNNYWPILWLKNLARIPQQHNTWLCYGHSIPNDNPSKPIADTEFEGVVIMDSVSLPEDFQEMNLGDVSLYIYTVIPVYPEEMEYKIKHNIDSLRNAFIDARIPDFVWVDRPSSVTENML
jgi:tetratricopeptide (TPR) repeat protein